MLNQNFLLFILLFINYSFIIFAVVMFQCARVCRRTGGCGPSRGRSSSRSWSPQVRGATNLPCWVTRSSQLSVSEFPILGKEVAVIYCPGETLLCLEFSIPDQNRPVSITLKTRISTTTTRAEENGEPDELPALRAAPLLSPSLRHLQTRRCPRAGEKKLGIHNRFLKRISIKIEY